MKTTLSIAATIVLFVAGIVATAHEGETHGAASEEITVKGEVLDLVCYVDHNATGEKHADCAAKCIQQGLPVGLKAENGKTYLLVGEHKPINAELVKHAAKTITVKGKAVSRDGFNMIENAEIVQ
jgi:type 1 fimbria pilin